MGDASLPSPSQVDLRQDGTEERTFPPNTSLRQVNILVTGFGAFKSFTTNPSYLIASALSRHLNPESTSCSEALKSVALNSQHAKHDPDPRPYQINIYVYPPPIRVAYDIVAELIPKLVADPSFQNTSSDFTKPENGFDYVLHIGMAAGRDNYTLETVAHRDHYKLKDVDDKDGSRAEAQWREQGLPELLDVGWNKDEVLSRWEALTRQREDDYELEEMTKAGWSDGKMTLVETARLRSQVFIGKGKRAVVKLSRDAGRYLCEFIFYTSLGTRWREARDAQNRDSEPLPELKDEPKEKIGKVAFLHVPGGTTPHDIARGARVAESAILALIGSWEDGYRNPDVYGGTKQEKLEARPASSLYEVRGTGDR